MGKNVKYRNRVQKLCIKTFYFTKKCILQDFPATPATRILHFFIGFFSRFDWVKMDKLNNGFNLPQKSLHLSQPWVDL